jgi:hypothetical protein
MLDVPRGIVIATYPINLMPKAEYRKSKGLAQEHLSTGHLPQGGVKGVERSLRIRGNAAKLYPVSVSVTAYPASRLGTGRAVPVAYY